MNRLYANILIGALGMNTGLIPGGPSHIMLRSAESMIIPDNGRSRGHGGKTPRTFSGVAKARRAAKQARRAH